MDEAMMNVVREEPRKPYIFVFDTETGGLPHITSNVPILQIAGVLLDPNLPGLPEVPLSKFDMYIKIPNDAVLQPYAMKMHRKHGRTQEYYNIHGTTASRAYEDIYDHLNGFCDPVNKLKVIPCGHNAGPFDVPLLLREGYRHGVDFGDVLDHHVIDTAGMAFERYGLLETNELKSVGLSKLAPFLGIPFDENAAHDAVYDRDITVQVLRKMLETK